MATTTLTIGQDVQDVMIYSYYTVQRGYGRQALYVDLKKVNSRSTCENSLIKDVYVMDVFPNVLEHFQHTYYIREHAIYDESRGVYTRDSGCGEYTEDCIFDSVIDLLNNVLSGREIEIEIEQEEVCNA